MAATTSFLGSPALLNPNSSQVENVPVNNKLVVKASAHSNSSRRNLIAIAATAALVGGLVAGDQAKAGITEDLLAKSAANKELNDKKRLATSYANLARAYTVQFDTCKFPYNFTGCEDLARKKGVKFLTEDIKLECEGKDKYKCGSNVFWKWGK